MAVTLHQPYGKVTEAQLDAFERKVGIALPDEYRRFLLAHNGGRPEPDAVPVKDRRGRVRLEMIDRFHGIHRGPHGNLEQYHDTFRERMPDGYLPIAHDPGGNQFVLSARHADWGKVFFWSHEDDPANFERVADTFDAFLDAICEEVL
jgi:hypothetical protein